MKPWHSEPEMMAVFDAVAFALTQYGSPREFVKTFKYRGFSEMAFLGTLGG